MAPTLPPPALTAGCESAKSQAKSWAWVVLSLLCCLHVTHLPLPACLLPACCLQVLKPFGKIVKVLKVLSIEVKAVARTGIDHTYTWCTLGHVLSIAIVVALVHPK